MAARSHASLGNQPPASEEVVPAFSLVGGAYVTGAGDQASRSIVVSGLQAET